LDRNLPTLVYNSYNLDPHWRKTEQANRILLLEPSHFKKFPVSEKVLKFVIELSTNNEGIQCWVAEIDELTKLVDGNTIISKEHPAFMHYPGAKDERDWLFPAVKEYFPSFSTYWKKAYLSYSKQI
jgi:deoxyribodipyrimidine photo-lyase